MQEEKIPRDHLKISGNFLMIADLAGSHVVATDGVCKIVPQRYLDVIRLFIRPEQRCDGEILFHVYEHLRQKASFWQEQTYFFFGDKANDSTLETFATTYHAWKNELAVHANVSDFCFAMIERWYQRLFFAHIVSGITEFDMGIIFRLANDINQRKNKMLLYSYKPVSPASTEELDKNFIREQRVKRFLN